MRPALVLLIASCATTSATKPPADPRAAITQQIQTQYAAIEKFDVDGWVAHHAPDVLWMGDEPIDVYTSKPDAVAAVKKFFAPIQQAGGTLKMHASTPKIVVAPDGHAAWIADEIGLEITVQGQSQTAPFRHTATWSEKDGQWWVIAEFWSLPLPNAQALEMAKAGKLPEPQKFAEVVGTGAQPVVAAVDQFVGQPSKIVEQFAQDVFLFGSDANEKIDGIEAAKKEFGSVNDVKLRRMDGIRTALVGPTTAYAAYNFELDAGGVKQPYRVLQVWTLEGGTWKLAQHHNANVRSGGGGN